MPAALNLFSTRTNVMRVSGHGESGLNSRPLGG
jgi:hypothetical protein